MSTSSPERTTGAGAGWLGRALVYALIYVLVGVAFAALAGQSGFVGARVWRFAAWLCSAVAFGTHVQYERVTVGRSAVAAALHASFAAAVGAFGLAFSAVIHRHLAGMRPSGLLAAALVIWPLMTAVPAFLVGWAAGMLMQPRGGVG